MTSKIVSVISLTLLFTSTVGFSQPRNIGKAKFLSPLENAVIDEINMARTAPKDYSSLLEQYKKYFDNKLLKLPGETPILTKEGVGAVIEAVQFLRSMKPVPLLTPSKGMSLAAKDHVKDFVLSGASQHVGSDHSQPWDRAKRYGTWQKVISEMISLGRDRDRDIVMSLIVDDGVSHRGHRKNIFNPDFQFIGVACGEHPDHRTICVITLAGGYIDR